MVAPAGFPLFPSLTPAVAELPHNVGNVYTWIDAYNSPVFERTVAGNDVRSIKSFTSLNSALITVTTKASDPIFANISTGRQMLVGNASNGFTGTLMSGPSHALSMFAVVKGTAGTYISYATDAGSFEANLGTIDIGGAVAYPVVGTIDDDVMHIVMARWDSDSGSVEVKVDDEDLTEVATGITTPLENATDIGVMQTDAGADGLVGELGEVIVWGNRLTDDQVNIVGKTLCNKWGLTWSNV